jgi:hypothetical protein
MPYSKFKAFLRKLAAGTVLALRRAIRCFIRVSALANLPTISGIQDMSRYDAVSAATVGRT